MSAQWETLWAGRAETAGLASAQVKLARCLLANRKITSEAAEAIHPESRPDRLFICEGLWAAEKLCQARIPVTHFLFSPEMAGALSPADRAQCACMLNYAAETFIISKKACEKISERDGADFCFLIAELPEYTLQELETRLPEQTVIMVLDGQEQPGNIGAILRSLDGAGGSFAVMTNRRVKPVHSRLIRSSLGAAFTHPLPEAPIEELLSWLKRWDFKVILTDLTASVPYFQADYTGRIAIVAGNEYTGISPIWRTLPNAVPVIIPMLGSCESLNVGFASTLVAYEAGLRQKFGGKFERSQYI